MLEGQRRCAWRAVILAVGFAAFACGTAYAKDSAKEAEEYLTKGNLKAAEIELRNAIRESPKDPLLHARLADVYLQLGDAAAAEARTARERDGNEADYLPVLADALLRQGKFADLAELIAPGDRDPVLESKVRTTLGAAAAGLRDRDKAEKLQREAIQLDPRAITPKIQLARLLNASKPQEADKLIDEAIAADPHAAEPLQVIRARCCGCAAIKTAPYASSTRR
jgi:Tfp pilus assembly protein PilF